MLNAANLDPGSDTTGGVLHLRNTGEGWENRYDGPFRRGHYEDTANGICALPATRLLEHARLTGDRSDRQSATPGPGRTRAKQTGKDDQRICSGQLQGNASAMGRAGIYHDPAS